jgi:hypothetical protein
MLVNIVLSREAVFSVIIVSCLSTVIYNFLYWCIMAMLGSNYSFTYMIKYLPLYLLYNTVVVVVLYFLMVNKVIRYHYDRYYK